MDRKGRHLQNLCASLREADLKGTHLHEDKEPADDKANHLEPLLDCEEGDQDSANCVTAGSEAGHPPKIPTQMPMVEPNASSLTLTMLSAFSLRTGCAGTASSHLSDAPSFSSSSSSLARTRERHMMPASETMLTPTARLYALANRSAFSLEGLTTGELPPQIVRPWAINCAGVSAVAGLLSAGPIIVCRARVVMNAS